MANLNKELKKLFFAHLKRVGEEKSKANASGNVGYCGGMTPPVTHSLLISLVYSMELPTMIITWAAYTFTNGLILIGFQRLIIH